MILTQCAVCATELGLTLGKKCGRCSTRYCGPECQKQHWEEGGHDQLCKKVKRAGGADGALREEHLVYGRRSGAALRVRLRTNAQLRILLVPYCRYLRSWAKKSARSQKTVS